MDLIWEAPQSSRILSQGLDPYEGGRSERRTGAEIFSEEGEMSLANKIREFINKEYLIPAREKGLTEVTIRAGDVHDKMGLVNRMPAVIGAIETNIFKRKYQIKGMQRKGIANGPNVNFTLLLTNTDK
jgi:hypothetical protein